MHKIRNNRIFFIFEFQRGCHDLLASPEYTTEELCNMFRDTITLKTVKSGTDFIKVKQQSRRPQHVAHTGRNFVKTKCSVCCTYCHKSNKSGTVFNKTKTKVLWSAHQYCQTDTRQSHSGSHYLS